MVERRFDLAHALELLERTPGFDVHLLEPGQLATNLRRAVHDGADRVLIGRDPQGAEFALVGK